MNSNTKHPSNTPIRVKMFNAILMQSQIEANYCINNVKYEQSIIV